MGGKKKADSVLSPFGIVDNEASPPELYGAKGKVDDLFTPQAGQNHQQ